MVGCNGRLEVEGHELRQAGSFCLRSILMLCHIFQYIDRLYFRLFFQVALLVVWQLFCTVISSGV